jgi:glycosyltransferase involved in cell wall biosynthesis
MRRPVVATRTGVALDYIKDGQSGLSVPTGRIEPLAQAIIRMLSDRDFAEQCSANAQLRVLAEDLSMEQRAMRFVEIYESVSNSNSR